MAANVPIWRIDWTAIGNLVMHHLVSAGLRGVSVAICIGCLYGLLKITHSELDIASDIEIKISHSCNKLEESAVSVFVADDNTLQVVVVSILAGAPKLLKCKISYSLNDIERPSDGPIIEESIFSAEFEKAGEGKFLAERTFSIPDVDLSGLTPKVIVTRLYTDKNDAFDSDAKQSLQFRNQNARFIITSSNNEIDKSIEGVPDNWLEWSGSRIRSQVKLEDIRFGFRRDYMIAVLAALLGLFLPIVVKGRP